ncbi:MAG TPA: UDP-4-amino-4,6-dideoxy-N-acetyl-beta-L-altrosamine transaminase [Methylocella sp.]
MDTIPYGCQTIEDEDVAAVVAALNSGWLTTGPQVDAFELAFAAFCGARCGVAVNSGTAALHAAIRALKIGTGDEVMVPAITFVASANCAAYEGATPVFADVDPQTLLIDPASVAARITERTEAIVVVDYAGQPADWDEIDALAKKHGVARVADACHSPGGSYKGRAVGTLADISAFSFHPVKHLTTAEGGMAVTDNESFADAMRRFRNHGIDSDHRQRAERGAFAYDMLELGYNYRLSDIQCALGLAQLSRLAAWVSRRQEIASAYGNAFASVPFVRPLMAKPDRAHAYHLYVVELDVEELGFDRAEALNRLRTAGIGVNVHYGPVHLMSYYRERFGYSRGLCPIAERMSERILTLPIYPGMSDSDQARVIEAVSGLRA